MLMALVFESEIYNFKTIKKKRKEKSSTIRHIFLNKLEIELNLTELTMT